MKHQKESECTSKEAAEIVMPMLTIRELGREINHAKTRLLLSEDENLRLKERIRELEADLVAQNLKLATIEMRLLLCTGIAGWDEALAVVLTERELYRWRPIEEMGII